MTDTERADFEDAEAVCRRFLRIDLSSEEGRIQMLSQGCKASLTEMLGREAS
jgi:hypothetical protein